jgi:hypothetical protein
METLIINGSKTTPEMTFEPGGSFSIRGTSVAENTYQLFSRAFEWMEKYRLNPAPNTTLEVFLTYFNTTTSKSLLNLMYMLRDIKESSNVDIKVKWLYEQDDSDMSEAGADYEEIVKIPFEHIAVK